MDLGGKLTRLDFRASSLLHRKRGLGGSSHMLVTPVFLLRRASTLLVVLLLTLPGPDVAFLNHHQGFHPGPHSRTICSGNPSSLLLALILLHRSDYTSPYPFGSLSVR